MCGKNQSQTSSSSPNPAAMSAYMNLLNRAGSVANLPFVPYGGEFTAPLNAQQNLAGANINQNAGFAQPFIAQGAQYANQAAQPITANDINQYQSPFTQDVVNATQADFANQNAQQLNMVRGNAAAQGALGGDREGIAEAVTAGQQAKAEAPVIAGLRNQGYSTALNTALQEQQNLGQSAYSLGNLGVAGQNAALTGASAQLGYGTLGQSTQQALDTALYQQFLAQQGFPFQETQWLAGIDTGVGSQMGGTSQSTGPAPNPFGQIAGLGIATLGLLNRGGGVPGYRRGGKIRGFALGGMPYAGGESYIPLMNLTPGAGAPKPPGSQGQGQGQQTDPLKQAGQIMDLEKKFQGLGKSWGNNADASQEELDQGGIGAGLSDEEMGVGIEGAFRRGGRIAGFAFGGGYADGGGDDSFDDRFNAAEALPERLQRSLALGDLTGAYSPSVSPTASQDGYLLDRSAAWNASGDSAYPLSGIDPANRGENNFGFDFNPVRTDANRAYGPNPGDYALPAYGTAPAQPLAPLPPGRDVADIRVAGLRSPSVDDTGGGYSGGPLGYAPSPELAARRGEPSEGDGRGRGLGLFKGLGLNLSPDMRKAMLAAGFAMMASRSPYLGNAIGEGGLAGLSAYTGSQKEAFNEKQAVEKLHQQAKIEQDKIARETKRDEATADYRRQQLERADKLLQQGKTPTGMRYNDKGELENIPGYTEAFAAQQKIKKPPLPGMSPEQREIQATQIAHGNMSPLQGLPRTGEGVAVRNQLRADAGEIIAREHPGMTPDQVADALNNAEQEFKARQIGINSGARTAGNREANLNLILRATDAAIPAALEASDKVARTGLVPLNRIIQKGEIMTSDPDLVEFGMANLQLAEHWARAMNPTGVMRESDRDKALHFLDTGLSNGTYKRAVMQLQKQITRERDAVKGVPANTPINPNAATPEPGAGVEGGGMTPGGGSRPVVHNKAEYDALPSGTPFTDANGKQWTKP